jgi:hypothetical protein
MLAFSAAKTKTEMTKYGIKNPLLSLNDKFCPLLVRYIWFVHQDGHSCLQQELVRASTAKVAKKKGSAKILAHCKGQKILQYQRLLAFPGKVKAA